MVVVYDQCEGMSCILKDEYLNLMISVASVSLGSCYVVERAVWKLVFMLMITLLYGILGAHSLRVSPVKSKSQEW